MPQIDRFGRDLDLTPEERDKMFRTAPISTRGYTALVDAIHDPAASQTEREDHLAAVAGELRLRARPGEEELAVQGLYKTFEDMTRNN